jgi:hypothetical protein
MRHRAAQNTPPRPLLASTTFDIPGHEITEHLGLVRRIIVRSPTIS